MTVENIEPEAVLPPLPMVTEESRPFWDSCKEGVLRLQRCSSCSAYRFPPSILCPNCSSMDHSWEEVSGRGSIFSFVTYRRLYHKAFASLLPYVVAVIELEEGPRMLSRLAGVRDPDSLKCGMAVKVHFEALSDEVVLPLFELAGAE